MVGTHTVFRVATINVDSLNIRENTKKKTNRCGLAPGIKVHGGRYQIHYGQVGQSLSGYAQVHGGFGYGCRNTEGQRILEYCTAQNLFICNTQFQKRDSHLITYSSGGGNTQIDYILLRAKHKQLVKDTKVIPGEEVFKQHRLVVCRHANHFFIFSPKMSTDQGKNEYFEAKMSNHPPKN